LGIRRSTRPMLPALLEHGDAKPRHVAEGEPEVAPSHLLKFLLAPHSGVMLFIRAEGCPTIPGSWSPAVACGHAAAASGGSPPSSGGRSPRCVTTVWSSLSISSGPIAVSSLPRDSGALAHITWEPRTAAEPRRGLTLSREQGVPCFGVGLSGFTAKDQGLLRPTHYWEARAPDQASGVEFMAIDRPRRAVPRGPGRFSISSRGAQAARGGQSAPTSPHASPRSTCGSLGGLGRADHVVLGVSATLRSRVVWPFIALIIPSRRASASPCFRATLRRFCVDSPLECHLADGCWSFPSARSAHAAAVARFVAVGAALALS